MLFALQFAQALYANRSMKKNKIAATLEGYQEGLGVTLLILTFCTYELNTRCLRSYDREHIGRHLGILRVLHQNCVLLTKRSIIIASDLVTSALE